MPDPLDRQRFEADLARWVQHRHGPGTAVVGLRPMPGNAGLSFGFSVVAGGRTLETLVVRLAPPGVRRRGNTDVLRQVPLLTTLAAADYPVAPLLWSTDDPAWFGTDVIVQPFLDALPLHMHDPAAGLTPVGDPAAYLRRAAEALADLHALDWRAGLQGWEEPRSVVDEVATWAPLLAKTPSPAWAEQGEALRTRLLETDPVGHRTGIFHGDFQTHNVLYAGDGRLAAVIDWEIAGIGAVGLDVGWFAMMLDESCWAAERRAVMQQRATPAEVAGWYGGLDHLNWYVALACYRYGAIAGLNLHLHRSGRRVDEVSALMGTSIPTLFARGLELCG